MKQTKICCMLLALALAALPLSGCGLRARVEEESPQIAQAEEPLQPPQEEAEQPAEETVEDEELPSENDPQSERREYDSEQDGETAPDAEQQIAALPDAQQEEPPAAQDAPAEPAAPAAAVETAGEAEKTVEVFTEADSAQQKAASEDAPAAASTLEYYQALLTSRLESQFECKKLEIYWERPAEFATINRGCPEQAIVTLAGSYNVGVKLEDSALTVDGGWVSRKNPGAIVKCVPQEALAAPEAVLSQLKGREGLAETDAVRTGRVILISESLLNTAAGQTAAAVAIACRLYPQLMGDVDPYEALQQLLEEAGRSAGGTYWY